MKRNILNESFKVNDICLSKNYGEFKILEFLKNKKVKIEFLKTKNICIKNYYDIRYGEVSDNKYDTHGIIGDIYTSLEDGDFKILDFEGKDKNGSFLYSIKFLNTQNIYYNILKSNISKRSVSDSNIHEFFIGEQFKTNQGDLVKIIDGPFRIIKGGKLRQIYKIQSILYPEFIKEYNRDDIKNGNIYNPLMPSSLSEYSGIGKYSKSKNTREYNIWKGILNRKKDDKRRNSVAYQDTEISDDFLNFQNFCSFFIKEKELYPSEYKESLECDKDYLYLINKLKKKIYSSETCLVIPSELNGYITGFYKKVTLFYNNKYKVEFPRGNWGYYRLFENEDEAFEVYFKERDRGFKYLLNKYKNILPDKYYNILIKFNYKDSYNWFHKTNY